MTRLANSTVRVMSSMLHFPSSVPSTEVWSKCTIENYKHPFVFWNVPLVSIILRSLQFLYVQKKPLLAAPFLLMNFPLSWSLNDPGPVSRNSRKLFGPEKPFAKLRPPYLLKLVFSYVVKGIKVKITAKFRALRRLGFEDTKRTMSPQNAPGKFREFGETGPWPE